MPFGHGFKDIDSEFEEMDRVMDRVLGRMRGWDWANMPVNKPVYYGFSMEIGPEGIPRVREFGNVSPGGAGVLEEGKREPFVTEVFDDESNRVCVTAELPGVDKEKLHVEATTDTITIRGEGEDRTYERTIDLEHEVDPESAKASFKNGILDVTLSLKEESPQKPKELDIE